MWLDWKYGPGSPIMKKRCQEDPRRQYFVAETVLGHNIFYTRGVLPEVNKKYLGD